MLASLLLVAAVAGGCAAVAPEPADGSVAVAVLARGDTPATGPGPITATVPAHGCALYRVQPLS